MSGTAEAPLAAHPGLRPEWPGDPAPVFPDAQATLDVVIFSKDRACQLDALLRSVRAFLDAPHRIHVLYTTSSGEFERGYDLLRSWHPGISWVDQGTMFRGELLNILRQAAAAASRFTMLLVDDMLLTRPFTAEPLLELLDVDDELLAVSLRLGDDIRYCYTRDCATRPPEFLAGRRWAWKDASPGYWNYPMSTDGNVYRTQELADYLEGFQFNNPNTLEAGMAGRPLPRPLLVCERTPCVVNLALNRVQSTFDNRHGDVTSASLNDALLAGLVIDVRPFIGKSQASCHIEPEVGFITDARPRRSASEPSTAGGVRRIDLRQIPCFVINLAEHSEKRRRIGAQLRELGIPHEFVPGIRAKPGWIGVALAHLKVLRLSRAQTPFLVLEDDCEFNEHFEPVIDVPGEADALYLGVSAYGLAEPGERGWGVARANRYSPHGAGFLRVYNLLARHAVVFLSTRFQEAVIASQVEALTNRSFAHPGDIGMAIEHASHVVLALDEPVCRQRERNETAHGLRKVGKLVRAPEPGHGERSSDSTAVEGHARSGWPRPRDRGDERDPIPIGPGRPIPVLVSHALELIVLRLPKNASSTVRAALRQLDPESKLCPRRDLSGETWQRYKLCTFLRDPIERSLAAYGEVLRRGVGPAQHIAQLPNGPQQLSAFLDWVEEGVDDPHVRPQAQLLGDARIDFVGHVQTLEADLGRLCQLLGIAAPALPHLNARSQDELQRATELLTPELRERMRRLYAEDFALLERAGRDDVADGAQQLCPVEFELREGGPQRLELPIWSRPLGSLLQLEHDLAQPGTRARIVQLPLEGGRKSLSFSSRELMSLRIDMAPQRRFFVDARESEQRAED